MDVRFETERPGGNMGKDEWLTPPEILFALGEFDLDPCAPEKRPWDTAKAHYTVKDNGLLMPWEGRVWCNPPYGKNVGAWLERCVMHRNCTVLIFARTETRTFFNYVWGEAYSLLFIKGRLQFYDVTGRCVGVNAGAPSVLVAYDLHNSILLEKSGIPGRFIFLK